MNLVWKLLRQHISVPQIAGFFFANLFGMTIILLGYQFYRDVIPVFTAPDSFMKADYLIVNKKIGTGNTISGRSANFFPSDIETLEQSPYVKRVARFTSAEYRIDASIGVNGKRLLNTEMYFESIPDGYIDVPLEQWKWKEGDQSVPIILPRSYINMYNFGFAQARSLPRISDGLVGMIDVELSLHGRGSTDIYKGRVVGFSSRLTTILVPDAFMQWSNGKYADQTEVNPTRLIVERQPNKEQQLNSYLEEQGYEAESGNPNAEKTISFLRLIVGLVVVIGIVIAILSFYILMLSIYLLVQKNAVKMQNLLLIGYSPSQVARPYQVLTVSMLTIVLLIAVAIIMIARTYYMGMIELLYPQLPTQSMFATLIIGIALVVLVSLFNIFAIRRKVMKCLHPTLE